jgi:lincosamide nucleotidyltransferase A/C/D/E
MPAESATMLLAALAREGVDACVGGGWAVDALLGEQTREHSDLDLWAPAASLHDVFRALVPLGVDRILPWPGDRPWNFVLHDGRTRRVDLHLYEPLPDGDLHYGSVTAPYVMPAAALSGRGAIAGVDVRCDDAAWSVRWHSGYPPRPSDSHDVALLCARFGIEVPDGF